MFELILNAYLGGGGKQEGLLFPPVKKELDLISDTEEADLETKR